MRTFTSGEMIVTQNTVIKPSLEEEESRQSSVAASSLGKWSGGLGFASIMRTNILHSSSGSARAKHERKATMTDDSGETMASASASGDERYKYST